MQRPIPIPLAISYGRADSVKNSGGVLWNVYAEIAPQDAKNPVTLTGSPGQLAWATLDTPPDDGPVVAGVVVNEVAYFATTKGLYKVKADKSVIDLGPLTLGSFATMATNGVDISMVDGVSTWNYTITEDEDDTPTPPVDATEDSDLFPARSVTSIDSFLVYDRADTGQFFHTELQSLTVDPLSPSTAEAYPDRAVCVFSNRRYLFVCGTNSIEPFYNAGGATNAFLRIDGATISHGIAGPKAIAANEAAMAYLSNSGLVYITDGLAPIMISTQAISDAIEGLDLTTATMVAYVHDGHPFFQLSIGTVTLVYDAGTKLWHGLRDETYGRHRATCVLGVYNTNLMGDAALPQVRELSEDAFSNVDDPLVVDIITPALHADQRVVRHGSFEIEVDTGEGGTEGESEGVVDLVDFDGFTLTKLDGTILTGLGDVPDHPVALLSSSDDDGRSWSEEEESSLGYDGDWLERVRWTRQGSARSRRYRVRIASAVRRSIVSRAWMVRGK